MLTRNGSRTSLVPGTKGFTFVLSMAMAATALSVDSVLPAFADIRSAMGLASDSTAVAGLITVFLMGSSIGLLPAGLLADRFGRRPVMWGGLLLFIAGAIAASLASSLTVMLIARFVWGLGSSGPRVAAMAMVRDAYAGEQMARQMSFIMAVFILVPTFAPTIAAGLLKIGPWQVVFWMCAVAAVAVALMVFRLPETLSVDERRPLAGGEVWQSCKIVVATPGTVSYLIAMTALLGVFIAYLSSSEIILDQVFDLKDWFPIFFGAMAIVMGVGMLLNGRIVERVGLDRLVARLLLGYGVVGVVFLVTALLTEGRPPFWLFVALLSGILITHGVLVPNINAAAMRPLAHVAGTAAAILGMVSGVLGAVLGSLINRAFDNSITPLAIGFACSSAVAIVTFRRATAESSRNQVEQILLAR